MPGSTTPVGFALNGIWLADGACLMQSHLPQAEGDAGMIRVIGVSDFGNWSGSVLMID